jgi:hypothetical protein
MRERKCWEAFQLPELSVSVVEVLNGLKFEKNQQHSKLQRNALWFSVL